jgi:hypothetical protein
VRPSRSAPASSPTAVGGLLEAVDHQRQDLRAGAARLHVVGRREQEALEVALGVLRQAERGRVGGRGLEVGERQAGALRQQLQRLLTLRPSGTVTRPTTRADGSSSSSSAAAELIFDRSR